MRIRRIVIRKWRYFANIELQLDDQAALVCIVGANGTGKSHLLELIGACAEKLGLSQGIEIPRGDPFSDPHEFSLQFYLAPGVSGAVEDAVGGRSGSSAWDRTVTISSERTGNDHLVIRFEAGGIVDAVERQQFAALVIAKLRESKEVHFLSLDANRAYPRKEINANEAAQAYEIDWAQAEFTRGRSFRPTTMLYDEWLKYFLAQENQAGMRLIRDIRKARQVNAIEPKFTDHFDKYRQSLQRVLPHLNFECVDPQKRTLLFNTTGLELPFDRLSGGEREIAFLIGQIDRFGLRRGLFLLDEPELHLNGDLIRSWVAYLTGTVETGQIWLATHSLEAVEAAGQQATFILERNPGTRRVESLTRLDTRPVLSALSRAVGTPAFSISQLVFVLVEGEEGLGERERYRNLVGFASHVRFIESGSCNEVRRRVEALKSLDRETDSGIRIGGVVDRDFRCDRQLAEYLKDSGVYALRVHEVENFFLHLATLRVLLDQNGRPGLDPEGLIRDAADKRAGSWIFQRTMATPNGLRLPEVSVAVKDCAKALSWSEIVRDRSAAIERIAQRARFDAADADKLRTILDNSISLYERKRMDSSLWRVCEGKQVLSDVARASGFADGPSLTSAAFTAWAREGAQIPEELMELRQY
jgi:ABC-type thiamine transport system ATPase subunit